MNKRIKAKWLKALRSGKYQQGQDQLRGIDPTTAEYEHCCLGVLADCAGERWRQDYEGMRLAEHLYLPAALLKRYGLTDKQQKRCATLNDRRWSFERIASYIQRYL